MSRKIAPEDTPLSPRRRKRKKKLESAKDARVFLSDLANDTYRGDLDAQRAGRIAYILSIFIKSVEVEQSQKPEGDASERMTPEEFPARIRTAMRAAMALVPPPPGKEAEE